MTIPGSSQNRPSLREDLKSVWQHRDQVPVKKIGRLVLGATELVVGFTISAASLTQGQVGLGAAGLAVMGHGASDLGFGPALNWFNGALGRSVDSEPRHQDGRFATLARQAGRVLLAASEIAVGVVVTSGSFAHGNPIGVVAGLAILGRGARNIVSASRASLEALDNLTVNQEPNEVPAPAADPVAT